MSGNYNFCPHCYSDKINKNGRNRKGEQLLKCKECGKTFVGKGFDVKPKTVLNPQNSIMPAHVHAPVRQSAPPVTKTQTSSNISDIVLTVLFGAFGYWRFRKGQILLGFLWLFTCGLCGIGWIIDIIQACQSYAKNKHAFQNSTQPKSYSIPSVTPQNQVSSTAHAQPTALSGSAASVPSNSAARGHYRVLRDSYRQEFGFCDDYIIFDLETTGLNSQTCDIIEIGAIRFQNNEQVSTFHSYVKIHSAIPPEITSLTGITDEMLFDAPEIDAVLWNFKNYIGDSVLVAHNAKFDMTFLQTFYHDLFGYTLENSAIDTLYLSRKYNKHLENHKLATIKDYYKIEAGSHNALDDCKVTAVLYQNCRQKEIQNQKKNEELNSFTEFETSIFQIVKQIIGNQNLDVSPLSLSKTGTYTDVCCDMYTMLRFKTGGRLQYWLVDMKIEDFQKKYHTALKCSEGSKNEPLQTRVFIKKANDLDPFQDYIMSEYQRCQDSSSAYSEWESKGKPMHLGIRSHISLDENHHPKVDFEEIEY